MLAGTGFRPVEKDSARGSLHVYPSAKDTLCQDDNYEKLRFGARVRYGTVDWTAEL